MLTCRFKHPSPGPPRPDASLSWRQVRAWNPAVFSDAPLRGDSAEQLLQNIALRWSKVLHCVPLNGDLRFPAFKLCDHRVHPQFPKLLAELASPGHRSEVDRMEDYVTDKLAEPAS